VGAGCGEASLAPLRHFVGGTAVWHRQVALVGGEGFSASPSLHQHWNYLYVNHVYIIVDYSPAKCTDPESGQERDWPESVRGVEEEL
jgi:hypothetical protein